MKNNSEKVIHYRRFHINIGIIIFVFIIIYVIFSVFSYLTTATVSEYEVTQGTITSNHIYKGLAVRSESLVDAPNSGYLNMYTINGSKAGVNDVICSIDTTGTVSSQLDQARDDSILDDSVLNQISVEIDNFLKTFDYNYFQTIVTNQEDISSKIDQGVNLALFENMGQDILEGINNHTFYTYKPSSPGIISYSYDGMEDVSVDNYSAESFQMSNYKKTNIEKNQKITEGLPMYRIVHDENWNIIIPVSADTASEFSDKKVMKIKFCKDNYQTYANVSVDCKANKYYLVFSLNKAMIRYVNDRYLDIELVISEKTGLKIPNSSIVEKNFYKIPKDYFMSGGDSSDIGILIQRVEKNKTYEEFITPTIYYSDDDWFYVDSEMVTNGDKILKSGSTDMYTIGDDIGTLTGVYNINKGYAVFKQIKIISQSEDYSIVETKTAYGIALYDHIALEGDKIIENQTIKK